MEFVQFTLPKFNSEFTPEKLPKPNRKPDRLPFPTFFRRILVKLPGEKSRVVHDEFDFWVCQSEGVMYIYFPKKTPNGWNRKKCPSDKLRIRTSHKPHHFFLCGVPRFFFRGARIFGMTQKPISMSASQRPLEEKSWKPHLPKQPYKVHYLHFRYLKSLMIHCL